MSSSLRIGTRGSRLALIQAHCVARLLRQADPLLAPEIVAIETRGDRQPEGHIAPGAGIFAAEVETALLEGRADLAVHSLKDLPVALAPGTVIAAVPRRAGAADVLVSRSGRGLGALPPGSRLGTSSLRRRAQLLRARADLEAVPLRGNVLTRLARVRRGDDGLSAAVLASAGLERLGLLYLVGERLPLETFLPCPGQGALAVQARADDGRAIGAARALEHRESRLACSAERAFLAELGLGCSAPVAALATLESGALTLRGAVYAPDPKDDARGEDSGDPAEAEELGRRLARRLAGASAGSVAGARVGAGAGAGVAAVREGSP